MNKFVHLFVLNDKQPWADYKEFIELMQYARWMSKAVYSFKIFLFKKEFKLTKAEDKAFCDI